MNEIMKIYDISREKLIEIINKKINTAIICYEMTDSEKSKRFMFMLKLYLDTIRDEGKISDIMQLQDICKECSSDLLEEFEKKCKESGSTIGYIYNCNGLMGDMYCLDFKTFLELPQEYLDLMKFP